MKEVIDNIQTQIASLPEIKYIDENWGQLDYYSSNPPVKFPCVLIDIINNTYSNIGQDRKMIPPNRQMSTFMVEIRVADVKLSNSSSRASQTQRNKARHILDVIEDIHAKVQGFCPTPMCGKMIRVSNNRVTRDDGIREYAIIYSADIQNI